MLSYKKLKERNINFIKLTGIRIEEFEKIVARIRPDWGFLQKNKKVAGRRSHIQTLEDEILLVLIYYRFYITHEFLGYLFNLDNSNVCRHLKRIEPLLAKGFPIKKDRTLSSECISEIILDVTEISTQRPKKKQKKNYSGKKKRHTHKFEIQINKEGKIINLSKGYGGRKHDFAIRKSEKALPIQSEKLADLGYQGLQKISSNVFLPIKKKKKVPRTKEERRYNKTLSSRRVLIENVFAKLKKFKIIGSVYRNFQKKLHMRINIIGGIYNYTLA